MGCSRAARLLSMLFLIAAAQKSIASFTGAYMVRMVVELPYDEAGFTSAVQGSFRQAVATATTTTADAVTVNSFAAAGSDSCPPVPAFATPCPVLMLVSYQQPLGEGGCWLQESMLTSALQKRAKEWLMHCHRKLQDTTCFQFAARVLSAHINAAPFSMLISRMTVQSDKLSLANLNAALEVCVTAHVRASAGLAPTTAIKTGPAVQLMSAPLPVLVAGLSQ
eukprot:2178690-Rhodomonas_salina.1